jgi:hypothetical protein
VLRSAHQTGNTKLQLLALTVSFCMYLLWMTIVMFIFISMATTTKDFSNLCSVSMFFLCQCSHVNNLKETHSISQNASYLRELVITLDA